MRCFRFAVRDRADEVAGMTLKLGFLLCLVGFMGPVPGAAQVETTTQVSGIVTDPSGGVVPAASVTVKNEDTGAVREGTTDASGFYSVVSLLPGKYMISVTKSGFKTAHVTGEVIQVASPARVDVTLELGTSAQSVTVSGSGAELLTTTTSEVSGTISSNLLTSIPIARQSFLDSLVLVPGVVPQNLYLNLSLGSENLNFVQTGGGGSTGDYSSSGIFAGGNRDSGTNISVDGTNVQSHNQQNVTQFISPAAVQEIRVESGNMNAEFGNGVSAVNVITKSGTNALHGIAYEYLRNNHLDAAPFFTNLFQQALPNFQQNQFGGALGGPIKKSKLLFFGNYDGMRVRQSSVGFESVPAAAVLNGDLSSVAAPIYNPFQYDPATGLRQRFPNNQIPLGPTSLCAPRPQCVDPVALAYLKNWVLPANATFNGGPVVYGNAETAINSNQYSGRLDFLQTSKSTIYGRYTYQSVTQIAGGVQPLEGGSNPYGANNTVLHWTAVMKPTMVNDLTLGYDRPTFGVQRITSHGNVAQQIGLHNAGYLPGGPEFDVGGLDLDVATNYIYNVVEDNFQIKDDLSWVRGRHTMKFGVELTDNRLYHVNFFHDQGQMSFGGEFSGACPAGNATCAAAAGRTQGGDPLADYMLGAPDGTDLRITPKYIGYQGYYSFYGQDSWRATSKLTVNYGLRYERWLPWLSPRNLTLHWDEATASLVYTLQNPLDYLDPSKCLGECAPLTPGVPRQGYKTGNLNLAPRLGLAYQLASHTLMRAAGGVFYDGNSDNGYLEMSGNPPFGQEQTLITTPDQQLPPLATADLFPAPSPRNIPQPNSNPPATLAITRLYRPTPAVYQWSFSLQRSLGSFWSVEVDYLGSHTIHEQLYQDLNSAVFPQGQYANLTLQQRRRWPQWGRVREQSPIGWARYNAMIASLRSRPWHGLTLMSNFTWAKDIITSDPGESDQGISSTYAPYALAGLAQWVPQKSLVIGYTYALPFGRGKPLGGSTGPVLSNVISGWSVSGISWFSNGSPQPVHSTVDLSGVALSIAFPDRICDPNKGPHTVAEWFNTSCFTAAPFGVLPNSPIGAVTYPGVNNWDMAINRSFATKFPNDTGHVEFRLDMFNAFNHTQWGNVDNYYGSSTFGEVLDTRPARKIQFALRYVF